MSAENKANSLILVMQDKSGPVAIDIKRHWEADGYDVKVISPEWEKPADELVAPIVQFAEASIGLSENVTIIGVGNEGLIAVSAAAALHEHEVRTVTVGTVFENSQLPERKSESFLRRRIRTMQEIGALSVTSDRFLNMIDSSIEGDPLDQVLLNANVYPIVRIEDERLVFSALTTHRGDISNIFKPPSRRK